MDTIYINGKSLSTLGVDGLLEYTITGTGISNEVFTGRFRTHFSVLASVPGTKAVTFTLVFKAQTRNAAVLLKSAVDAEFVGQVELKMPDDLYYTCYSSAIGEIMLKGSDSGWIGTAVYKCTGFCHDQLVTETGTSINCTSTMPRTDCKLEYTVPAAVNVYTLGTVAFTNLSAGDVLTADGIEGRFLVNNAPAVNRVIFTEFPYLVPGENTFPDAVTVTYYPTYI